MNVTRKLEHELNPKFPQDYKWNNICKNLLIFIHETMFYWSDGAKVNQIRLGIPALSSK